ncbi:carboxypeptidase-like regulatory domain-containing protein [Reichenbachiella ulvae]|uniref:Carboxypeptidase-like regulatory domain-containing protein n=1 Tax=Reichenbachiella ulvae TaxID=2980104 RepID=A0ABT3CS82_9BACT|nr:carboxypeptidase-like regulatory domain-containing protein [Reichenbachiella ulvae]MCV9386561.1 carboxypeptidase-like regulatory domain-containing protein [Reichenbachiella ulvae]
MDKGLIHFWFFVIQLLLLFVSSTDLYAQRRILNREISLQVQEVPFDSVLQSISYQSDVLFSYDASLIPSNQRFTLHYPKATVEQAIIQLLKGTGIDYRLVKDQVVFFKVAEESEEKKEFEKVKLIGTILDTNGEPVIGANVFIANTVKGGATDALGNFEIKNLEVGVYELVISHLQYVNAYYKITIDGKREFIHLPIRMEPSFTELGDVQVLSDNKLYRQNKRYIDMFTSRFLGSSSNSDKCSILNPEVLDVTYDRSENMLSATAVAPIEIVNEALGYKINFVLDYMEDNGKTNHTVGFANFEELEPEDKRQRKRWNKNRKRSYQGSLIHFLQALSKDRLRREGFHIRYVKNLPDRVTSDLYDVSMSESLRRDDIMVGNKLKCEYYLEIVYTREKEGADYLLMNRDSNDRTIHSSGMVNQNFGQISYIKLNLPSVTVSPKGYFVEPLAITTYGYWAWERVSEFMPFDYEP